VDKIGGMIKEIAWAGHELKRIKNKLRKCKHKKKSLETIAFHYNMKILKTIIDKIYELDFRKENMLG
jgi:predicted transcriptional regulator